MRPLANSILFACLCLSLAAATQAQPETSPLSVATSEGSPSPVLLDGRILFQVHGVKAITASRRATEDG